MRSLRYVVVVGSLFAVAPPIAIGQEPRHEGPRSERTALLLGLSGVALSWAWSAASDHPEKGQTLVAGVIVGPALGHLYADNYRRAIGGALGRTGLAAAGFAVYFDQCQILGPCNKDAANATLALAGVAVLAWAALDLVKAPESARRYNARHASQGSPDLVPAPREPDREAGPLLGCVTLCRGRQ